MTSPEYHPPEPSHPRQAALRFPCPEDGCDGYAEVLDPPKLRRGQRIEVKCPSAGHLGTQNGVHAIYVVNPE